MCNTVTLSFPSLIYNPDVYTNELSSVKFSRISVVTLYTNTKIMSLFEMYCWICHRVIFSYLLQSNYIFCLHHRLMHLVRCSTYYANFNLQREYLLPIQSLNLKHLQNIERLLATCFQVAGKRIIKENHIQTRTQEQRQSYNPRVITEAKQL